MARIFVTGGTGFIGSHVLKDLLGAGFQNIRALYREGSSFDRVSEIKSQIDWHKGDLFDVPSLEAAMQDCDIVIHCAGIISYQKPARKELLDVNAEGTENMVNIALYHGIDHFVHLSSTAALGRNRQEEIIDENHKWEYNNLNTSYGISKFRAEQEVWRGIAEGLQATILNPSMVLGNDNWKEGLGPLFGQVWKGINYAPRGANGVVAVQDVCEAVVKSIELKNYGERFIINADNLSYQGIMEIIAEQLDRTAPQKILNQGQAKWYRRYRNITEKLGANKSGLTKELLLNLNHQNQFDNQKSIEVLGLNYQPVADALAEMANQFLADQKAESLI